VLLETVYSKVHLIYMVPKHQRIFEAQARCLDRRRQDYLLQTQFNSHLDWGQWAVLEVLEVLGHEACTTGN